MSSTFNQIKAAVDRMLPGRTDDMYNAPLLFPSVTIDDVEVAESALGFKLPTLLKQIYIQIGNGGQHLGGIMGIVAPGKHQIEVPNEDDDLVQTYTDFFDPANKKGWPEKMLPYINLGCNAWLCVNCNDPKHSVWAYVADYRGPDIEPPEGLTPEEQDEFMEPHWEEYESNLDGSDLSQPFWVQISPSLNHWWQKWLADPSASWDPRMKKTRHNNALNAKPR